MQGENVKNSGFAEGFIFLFIIAFHGGLWYTLSVQIWQIRKKETDA